MYRDPEAIIVDDGEMEAVEEEEELKLEEIKEDQPLSDDQKSEEEKCVESLLTSLANIQVSDRKQCIRMEKAFWDDLEKISAKLGDDEDSVEHAQMHRTVSCWVYYAVRCPDNAEPSETARLRRAIEWLSRYHKHKEIKSQLLLDRLAREEEILNGEPSWLNRIVESEA